MVDAGLTLVNKVKGGSQTVSALMIDMQCALDYVKKQTLIETLARVKLLNQKISWVNSSMTNRKDSMIVDEAADPEKTIKQEFRKAHPSHLCQSLLVIYPAVVLNYS